ncbi:MAG: hypothetical protein R3C68_07075 [Myxococcota bacterium]
MNWIPQRGRFPQVRHRRKRTYPWLRALVAESALQAQDLILPLFVHDRPSIEPVESMPGVERLPIPCILERAKQACEAGISALALFPAVEGSLKQDDAREAYNPENLICRTVAAVKEAGIDIGIICDVALDPYTSHGHDGLLRDGYVANDETLDVLCRQALAQARAGCDIIAPSI